MADILTPFYLIALGVVFLVIFSVGIVVFLRATLRQHNYLVKWDFLHAAENIDERVNPRRPR